MEPTQQKLIRAWHECGKALKALEAAELAMTEADRLEGQFPKQISKASIAATQAQASIAMQLMTDYPEACSFTVSQGE